jgi:predicted HicB family RNase H-like nuclease
MANDLLEYRGYHGSVDFSAEDEIFHGKVQFIESLLIYYGTSVNEIKKEFHDTVDSYLAFCEQNGKEPNKPYTGSFNVRTGPDLHRAAAIAAMKSGKKLNEYVRLAIQEKVDFDNGKVSEATRMASPFRDFLLVESFTSSRVSTITGARAHIAESRQTDIPPEASQATKKTDKPQFSLQ